MTLREQAMLTAAPSVVAMDQLVREVTEANLVGDAIVGAAINDTGAATTGPYSVATCCFDKNKIVGHTSDYAEPSGDLDEGAQVTFAVDLYGDKCDSFVVGVGGYFS